MSAFPVVVVEDSPELLVTYLPEESPFVFPPSADGLLDSVGAQARLARQRDARSASPRRGVLGHALLERARPAIRRVVPQPGGAVSPDGDRLRHTGPRARRLGSGRRGRGSSRTATYSTSEFARAASPRSRPSAIRRVGDELPSSSSIAASAGGTSAGRRSHPKRAWCAPTFPDGWEATPLTRGAASERIPVAPVLGGPGQRRDRLATGPAGHREPGTDAFMPSEKPGPTSHRHEVRYVSD